MPPRIQKNLRLPPSTIEQLAALTNFYVTEAAVVAIAVQTLHEKHQEPQEVANKHPVTSDETKVIGGEQ